MLRPLSLIGGLLLVGAVAGCSSDKRFEKLTVGMPKDSALAAFGVEKPTRIDPYLVGGHYIEAMYYRKPGAKDSVPDRKMSPVILSDGVVVAWGWKQWDSVAGANHIVVEKK